MDANLAEIKKRIVDASPGYHYPIGLLCDYIAKEMADARQRISDLEDALAELETEDGDEIGT